MTPLPVDPRCDIDLVDVMRAMWQRKERGEKDDLAGLLAAGRKPTLIVCEKLKPDRPARLTAGPNRRPYV